ncbi:mucin-22-like [Stegastes partitus]|uniref:Mucin-22-like n=1 Tax=Stegastes partitus TaxID=144197 RepID=A0A9Y4KB71_9TELE|nr:PREDICTED: mucin-22-like [Stegastes partitus]
MKLMFLEPHVDTEPEETDSHVSEVALVGPPGLYRTGFTSVGPLAAITVAWTRSENKLARLLPVCFAANTNSLQSEPRCVWLYQREMKALPTGTELKCGKSEMTLVLPVTSLSEINLAELQLNSPTCPVSYNSTHLTASIPLSGCGTKTVHSGNELVYTNTLKSVRPFTMVSRKPSLMLPLACRIPATLVKGPNYQISMPTETEVFGVIEVWLEIHLPGQGPLSRFTADAQFRTNNIYRGRIRRQAESETQSDVTTTASTSNTTTSSASTTTAAAIGSRIESLDLHVLSNCSVDRAEMVVSKCLESETEDFAESRPIVDQGCMMSSESFEIMTTQNNSRVYRLNMTAMELTGSTMYIRCTVNLCIATMPSAKCPDLCTRSIGHRTLIGSVFTSSYTVTSGPVSLVVTTPAPTTVTDTPTTITTTTTTTTGATLTPVINTVSVVPTTATTARAPEKSWSLITAATLTAVSIFLQKFVLH